MILLVDEQLLPNAQSVRSRMNVTVLPINNNSPAVITGAMTIIRYTGHYMQRLYPVQVMALYPTRPCINCPIMGRASRVMRVSSTERRKHINLTQDGYCAAGWYFVTMLLCLSYHCYICIRSSSRRRHPAFFYGDAMGKNLSVCNLWLSLTATCWELQFHNSWRATGCRSLL